MQSTYSVTPIPIPVANAGTRNVIPVNSQIGIINGAASLTDGYPPLTSTDPADGGVPPDRADMNGLLYLMSQTDLWSQVGGRFRFSASFATAISGYPAGACLMSNDLTVVFLSTVENNSNDPNTTSTGWVPFEVSGFSTVALTGANATLSPPQYSRQLVVLTGTLTANINLILPALPRQWILLNQCVMGAFGIVAKTAGGTGTSLAPGANPVFGDGANIDPLFPMASTGAAGIVALASAADVALGTSTTKAVTPASLVDPTDVINNSSWSYSHPGGHIVKGGYVPVQSVPISTVANIPVTWATPFPNACLGIRLGKINSNGGAAGDNVSVKMDATTHLPVMDVNGFTICLENNDTATALLIGAFWEATGY